MTICGSRHPDHPEVTCNIHDALHDEHFGAFGGGTIDWPNEEYEPPVQKKIAKDARSKAADSIVKVISQPPGPPPQEAVLPEVDDAVTLRQAQESLLQALNDGVDCPCCGQLAKVYKRSLSKASAQCLEVLYREARTEWAHLPTVLSERAPSLATTGGYAALAGHWGLMEEADRIRDDGGRAGWWRVTSRGEQFLLGTITIPKYVRLYDGNVLGHTGAEINISDALRQSFDLRKVMGSGASLQDFSGD